MARLGMMLCFVGMLSACEGTAAPPPPRFAESAIPEPSPLAVGAERPLADEAPSRPAPKRWETRTIGADSTAYTAPAPTTRVCEGCAAPATTVNVVVVQQPPPVYGYGVGYGYPVRSGFGATGTGFSDARGGRPVTSPTTGGVYPGRAAAPGGLPPVGGDWPTVPSYGPRPGAR